MKRTSGDESMVGWMDGGREGGIDGSMNGSRDEVECMELNEGTKEGMNEGSKEWLNVW